MLEELLEGWIVRKDGYYVSAFLDSSLKWEEKIDIEEVPFISYLVKTLKLDKYYTTKEVVRLKAFQFAKVTLNSIGVNTIKHKLRLNHSSHDSYTDSKTIVVSTLPLYEEECEEYNGYDVFVGIALHEGCHILYTDFTEHFEHIKSLDLPKGAQSLFATLANIIEDERIERRLMDHYPGQGSYIARLKEYYFRKGDKVGIDEDENVSEFMNLLIRIIRYPKYIDDLLFERYSDLLFSVKDILIDYPEEMGEMLEKTTEVFNLILEYFDLKYEHEEDDKELSGAMEEVKKTFKEGVSTATSIEEYEGGTGKPRFEDEKDDAEKILDGEVGMTKSGMHLRAEDSTKENYLRLLAPLKHLIPGFRHFLAYNTHVKIANYVGLREGKLDTSKLVEGIQGVQSIYYRTEKPVLKKLNVAMLVDLSGSMGGERIEIARECTILLTEVFSKNKAVDLYVYGYTGQNITDKKAELYEFYTPRNPRKYSLANMRAIAQNLDGYSLLQVQEQVRKQTREDVLLFMISDGEPYAAGYHGSEAIRHLKGCVKTLEKDKFKIIHLAISYKGLPDVYKNLVHVSDISNLAKDLYLCVKQTLRRKN